MKQKAKVYKGKRIVMGDKNLVTKNEIHVNDIPQEGGESSGGDTPSTPSRPKWTGHADVEGLKAIGWTDEDIAYYQEYGVNWNAEDDEYHKVTDDNKALYGVLTADNISSYRDRIVYLPKIDTSGRTSMKNMFQNCYSLVSIPQLDTQNVLSMDSMFSCCYVLVNIPQLDTRNVSNMNYMFNSCRSLIHIPKLNTQNVVNMNYIFWECFSLVSSPLMDTTNVQSTVQAFNYCNSLVSIPQFDMQNVTSTTPMFFQCYSLSNVNLKNIKYGYPLIHSPNLSKESLLYIINNEAATSAITITLHSYAYTRLAEDADVVAALANHPNISLSK